MEATPTPSLQVPSLSPTTWLIEQKLTELATELGPRTSSENTAAGQATSDSPYHLQQSLGADMNDETGEVNSTSIHQQHLDTERMAPQLSHLPASHQSKEPLQPRCPECNKVIVRQSDVARHIAEQHGSHSRLHPCPHASCSRSQRGFKRKEHLNNHLRQCHQSGGLTLKTSTGKADGQSLENDPMQERLPGSFFFEEFSSSVPSTMHLDTKSVY